MTTRNEEYSVPSFSADPVTYLEAITRSAPSKDLLSRLAGPVASSMKEEATAALAPLYLRAVAQQLAAETAPATAPAAAAASAGAGAGAIASNVKLEMEAEMKSSHQIYEIAEVRLCVVVLATLDSAGLD
jgi:hypothetical protein